MLPVEALGAEVWERTTRPGPDKCLKHTGGKYLLCRELAERARWRDSRPRLLVDAYPLRTTSPLIYPDHSWRYAHPRSAPKCAARDLGHSACNRFRGSCFVPLLFVAQPLANQYNKSMLPTPSRVAIVTAASKGIGRTIATELSRRAWTPVILARSEEVGSIAAELGGVGVRGSVSVEEDLQRLVQTALQRYGRIDAVVNNTGHPAKGDPFELTDVEWDDGYDLILRSVIRLARAVMPTMVQQRSGVFVNVSSYAARKPEIERPVSSVFRAALSAWTRVHAEYGAAYGIRVNSVLPGFVDSYPIGPEIEATIPMKRVGRLEELAKTVAFLLSEDASYITGQNLLMDGGMVPTI